MLHKLEAWCHPCASRKTANLLIGLLLAADVEDALALIDDVAGGTLEVELVADLHVVHVLREPSAVREPRVLILVVRLDHQVDPAEGVGRGDRRVP